MTQRHSPPIRVVIVDDEEDFREPLGRFLRKSGMVVSGVGSVEDLTELLSEVTPDIIILDINLPGESGLEAVQRLRQSTGAGLIMVTARGAVDDRIRGLALGADSYLGKPVDVRELEAVIRSLNSRLAEPQEPQETWLFDVEGWTLASPDGETAQLSVAEHSVLTALSQIPGQPVARDDLFAALGKVSHGPDDRRLDVLISRLRRKFMTSAYALSIRSVRGVGYVFPAVVRRRP